MNPTTQKRHQPSTHAPRALISVSDKTGIKELARVLCQCGWEILSTGGTAQFLRENGIAVTDVASLTGFPEILGGRVKTLHPNIHGALLAKREDAEHRAQLTEFGIGVIDVLVVNLYPFVQTINKTGCTFEQAIEHIDIGGPAMIRAAAKNHAHLSVVVNPADYPILIDAVKSHEEKGFPSQTQRLKWAAAAYAHTAAYDKAITDYLQQVINDSSQSPSDKDNKTSLPDSLSLSLTKSLDMRYGENAHQHAAFYQITGEAPSGLAKAKVIQGKVLSYNNMADAHAAWGCVCDLRYDKRPACVIVKHANPCGVALGKTTLEAYQRAFACDPTSAFGGIIAFNQMVDATCALQVGEQFSEVIMAPDFTPEALAIFAKKPNVRILQMPADTLEPYNKGEGKNAVNALEIRAIFGGFLVQTPDVPLYDKPPQCTTIKTPSEEQLTELRFAFTVAKHVKSNAIVFTKNNQTLGIGAGQMSRVDSTRIAVSKAKERGFDLKGSFAASDAFFPFRDGLDELAKAGAQAVIHPGGSMRDAEVIAAANEHGIVMITTGMRHFRH